MARPRMAILLLIASFVNIFCQLLPGPTTEVVPDKIALVLVKRALVKILKRQDMKEYKSLISQNQLKKSWGIFLSSDPNILQRMAKRSLVYRNMYNHKMGSGNKSYQARLK